MTAWRGLDQKIISRVQRRAGQNRRFAGHMEMYAHSELFTSPMSSLTTQESPIGRRRCAMRLRNDADNGLLFTVFAQFRSRQQLNLLSLSKAPGSRGTRRIEKACQVHPSETQ